MLKLSIGAMIEKIRSREPFVALSEDGSFSLAVEEYVPFVCLAVHNGGNLREGLRDKIRLEKMDRWREEDPYTWQFIASLPIRLIVYSSRYEFDVNRNEAECIYETAWGQQVWKEPITDEEKTLSREKHRNFYKVLHALVASIEQRFGGCLVFDIHSYNFRRLDEQGIETPVFNLGTERITDPRFRPFIDHWLAELRKIDLQSIPMTVQENGVFYGRGYVLESLQREFQHTLVFATEVKKIYVDEQNGDEFPEYIDRIRAGMKQAILNTAYFFTDRFTRLDVSDKYALLADMSDDALMLVDRELHTLLEAFEILAFVNPTNLEAEKKHFFDRKRRHGPQFRYPPTPFDPNEIRLNLYRIPTHKIHDITCKKLYEDVVESSINRLEMLTLRGQEAFLYSSLKYFGKPSPVDLQNATYLLRCHDPETERKPEPLLDADQIKGMLESMAASYGIDCRVKLVKNLSASAMVLNATRTVKLRRSHRDTERNVRALASHEIGVHMLTTHNADVQPLRICSLGFPRYTMTQEGLAIFNEYLNGTLTISRLRMLALRVVAVDGMIRGLEFPELFELMTDEHGMEPEAAFHLCTRVWRAGGFTKDYLYLKGFIAALRHYERGYDMAPLMVGKTAFEYLNVINELKERNLIETPALMPTEYARPTNADPILAYVLKGLRES